MKDKDIRDAPLYFKDFIRQNNQDERLKDGEALEKMTGKAECIIFANHKGGTGKTTSCLSIAGYLAKDGYKVLVVDLDPQANATSGLGIETTSLQYSIYDMILDQCIWHEGMRITQIILETDVENLHLVPSELDLTVAEVVMQDVKDRTFILDRILETVKLRYDYILIDSPPSWSLLTLNGLCAANQVIVPLDPSIFSLEALDNLKRSFQDIKQMTGHSFDQIIAILIRYVKSTVFSRILRKRTTSQEVEIRLREMFHTVFVVPDSAEVFQAQREDIPISHYAPKSKAGKAYAEIASNISMHTQRRK